MDTKNIFMILSVVVLSLFGNVQSAREPPTVNLPGQGMVMGAYKTLYRTQRIIAYLGLPYAQPPTGQRRFTPPEVQELPIWEGMRNATLPAPSCLQDTTGRRPLRKHDELFAKLLESQADDAGEKLYDEDCLYLNVYMPEGPPPAAGFPAMVWFHPGDFMRGSPNDINPFQLVFKHKVIVVTVAYRLNIFGFFTTMDGEAPGNFGLMDQAGALEWVRNNAEVFGGKKDNICIFGYGSGAVSAGLHLLSGEWSDRTFQRIIAMSGSVLAPNIVKPAYKEFKTVNRVADAFGCFRTPTSALITCLRNVNPQIMLEQGEPLTDWGPIIDFGLSNSSKPFIPDYPERLFERGQFVQVPIMIGYTDMEDALLLNKEDVEDAGITKQEYDTMLNDIVLSDLAVESTNDSCFTNQQHIFDTVSFFYNPVPPTTNETVLRKMFLDYYMEKNYGAPVYMMAKHMSKYVPTYTYRFDLKPLSAAVNEGIPSWMGVVHNFDLVFVLGLPYLASPIEISKWQTSDKRISDIIMKLWTNFAGSSNPTNADVFITWEDFKPDNPRYLIIDRTFNMSGPSSINFKAFEFWNDFFPKVMDLSTQCCNDTDSGSSIVRTSYTATTGLLYVAFTILFVCKDIVEHAFVGIA